MSLLRVAELGFPVVGGGGVQEIRCLCLAAKCPPWVIMAWMV